MCLMAQWILEEPGTMRPQACKPRLGPEHQGRSPVPIQKFPLKSAAPSLHLFSGLSGSNFKI